VGGWWRVVGGPPDVSVKSNDVYYNNIICHPNFFV